jgi:peptidylprolyl isomerase
MKAVPYNVTGLVENTTPSGLKYIIVEQGSGKQPTKGNIVTVDYTGYFTDGKIFDSSVERGQPLKFPLGVGMVIQGWDEGLSLMKVGDKFRLIIPYHLGYGEKDYGPIPGKSTLIFDVELINC